MADIKKGALCTVAGLTTTAALMGLVYGANELGRWELDQYKYQKAVGVEYALAFEQLVWASFAGMVAYCCMRCCDIVKPDRLDAVTSHPAHWSIQSIFKTALFVGFIWTVGNLLTGGMRAEIDDPRNNDDDCIPAADDDANCPTYVNTGSRDEFWRVSMVGMLVVLPTLTVMAFVVAHCLKGRLQNQEQSDGAAAVASPVYHSLQDQARVGTSANPSLPSAPFPAP